MNSIPCRCMVTAVGFSQSVALRPNPGFLPKGLIELHLAQSVELQSLFSPSAGEEVEQSQSALCPVRALTAYIRRTQAVRPWAFGQSKSRLSHWVADTIRQAYALSGVPVPPGVRAHSTRGVAASWAFHMLCRHVVVSVNLY